MIKTFESNAHKIIFVVISRVENAWTLNVPLNKVALGPECEYYLAIRIPQLSVFAVIRGSFKFSTTQNGDQADNKFSASHVSYKLRWIFG